MLAGLGYPLQFTLAASAAMLAVLVMVITPYSLLAIWMELKVAAHMQDRVGPMIPGGWHGWATSLADGVKLLLKEDLIPTEADTFLFWLAPMLAFTGAFTVFAVIPWGIGLVPASLDIGAFFVIAISSLTTIGLIMGGWASNNKYSLMGGLRSAAQAVSFEIPLIVSLVPVIFVTGTLNLVEITQMQKGGLLDWLIFAKFPFLFIGFFVFMIAAVAEVNRTPFDMPEAEQEVVGGFHVEFSSIRFGMFFLGEYAAMLAQGLIIGVLFLGGWYGAWPVMGTIPTLAVTFGLLVTLLVGRGLGEYLYPDTHEDILWFRAFTAVMAISLFAVPILIGTGPMTIFMKGLLFVVFLLCLRWTLPRVRPDQLMYTCWKVLLPVAFFNLLGVGAWIIWLQ